VSWQALQAIDLTTTSFYGDRQGNLKRSQALLARLEIQKTGEIIEWSETGSFSRSSSRPLQDLPGAERLQEAKDRNINVTETNSSRADHASWQNYSNPASTRHRVATRRRSGGNLYSGFSDTDGGVRGRARESSPKMLHICSICGTLYP
jgi:hypothetical protein